MRFFHKSDSVLRKLIMKSDNCSLIPKKLKIGRKYYILVKFTYIYNN